MQKLRGNDKKLLTVDSSYEKHVNLSIQWNRLLLKSMGLWPNSSNVSFIEKYFTRLINAVCYGLICYLLIPCSLYVFLDVKNIFKEIKLFGPLIFCVAALLKYHWLILHGDDIRMCVDHIKWDWKNITYEEDREIMEINANFGNRIVTVCAFFMYTGFTFYFLVVPLGLEKMVAEDLNVTFIPMVFPFSRFIIDVRYSPINEIFFSIQIIAGVLIHAITVGACSLAAMFAVHACGQMDVLMSWLVHLTDGRSDMSKTVDGRIASIVNQHVRILKQLPIIVFQILRDRRENTSASIVRGIISVYLESLFRWILHNNGMEFEQFNDYYNIRELVVEQCKKVGEVSYMIEWYRLPGNKKLCCVLIMAMSNSSIKFTAGNIVELSIDTFSSVIRTSVAFLNALRTLS
ncbi:hypothetical protein ANTRET_LOCUS3998 [Anthophora retusa]